MCITLIDVNFVHVSQHLTVQSQVIKQRKNVDINFFVNLPEPVLAIWSCPCIGPDKSNINPFHAE